MKLTITYKDQVKCLINGLTPQDKDMLYKEFSVFIPTARYMPKYKLGIFDGRIHYFTLTNQTYVNLLPKIFEKLDMSKYEIEYVYPENFVHDPNLGNDIDENFFAPQVWYKGHRLEGQPIKLEEHQIRIINTCINNHRCLIDSCTSSGKTIISAALAKLCQPFGKVILVVPSQDLCLQSADEFKLLGLDTGIVGCGLREFDHKVIVCTWQTINSLERRTKGSKKVKENPLSAEELQKLKENVVSLIFDECFDGNTKILMADGSTKLIKDCKKGDEIISYNEEENKFEIDTIEKLHENLSVSSTEEMYELELENNEIIKVTGNHKVLTTDGWKMVKELTINDEIISYVRDNKIDNESHYQLYTNRMNEKLSQFSKLKIISYTNVCMKLSNGLIIQGKNNRNKFTKRLNKENCYYIFDKLYDIDINNRKNAENQYKFDNCSKGGKNNWKVNKEKLLSSILNNLKKARESGNCWKNHNIWSTGKTKYNDERLMNISRERTGEKNHMFGKHLSNETKRKESESMKKLILDGKFTPNIHNRFTHYSCIIDNIKYRSSWEGFFALLNPTYKYEDLRIPYIFNGKGRIYIVDFINYDEKTVCEIKPKKLFLKEISIAKEKALKEWCIKNNFIYKRIDEDYIKENFNNIDLSKFDERNKNNLLKVIKNENKEYKNN